MGLSLYVREEERAFLDLATSFAEKSVAALFGGEWADGNLEMVPGLLDKAFEMGLAASPDKLMPGYEYGIWAAGVRESGMRLSAVLLSVLAEVCGGIAMNLHAQGLASYIITGSGRELQNPPRLAALAYQEGYGPPGYGTLLDPDSDAPAKVLTLACSTGTGYVINGKKSFVYAMKGPEAFVVFCKVDGETDKMWGCFLVPATAQGVAMHPVSDRTGLRACELCHIDFDNVEVPASARLDEANGLSLVKQAMCINWLGIAAIASGVARGAVKEARAYASTRYQGGAMIESHPAVQKLIAFSEARVQTASAFLIQTASLNLDNGNLLHSCAAAKLMVTEMSFGAVTDSLQVFGGYGYMEDYGMEKRLRDVAVLKSLAGSQNHLEMFLFEAGRGVS